MSDDPTEPTTPRDAPNWAQVTPRFEVGEVPREAINLNVQGRQALSPLQGFGQMWQKIYSVRLSGSEVAPAEVIATWKQRFPEFWPPGNAFYGPLTGIAPGEVALINADVPGGIKLSTGVMVLYADDESFTFMTPQGHMFAGWITFSASEDEGATVAQIQVLIRATDPLTEATFRLGFGHRMEDAFWRTTLVNLAQHFGVRGQPTQQVTCVDPRVQWSEAKNLWHNSAIRSAFYTPVRLLRGVFRR